MSPVKIKSSLCDMLGIDYPIIQAGMGPFNTSKLAAAVSNAGGLGTVSIPGDQDPVGDPKTLVGYLHQVKKDTGRNFAVNTPIASERTSPKLVLETHDAMIKAVCEAKAKDSELRKRLVLFITSGGNPTNHHKMIKDAGFLHFHVCGSVRHALLCERLGLDGVIASGYEMGGHTHLADRAIHTFILVPSIAQAITKPVVASGGICDARTFVAALAMGAAGVQMGTRFITTKECDFHENYKKFIVDAGEYSDIVFPSFIAPARGLKSPAVYKLIEAQQKVERGELDPTVKAKMLEEILRKGEQEGDMVEGAVAAGQVSSRINSIVTAKEVIDTIIEGSGKVIQELQQKIM